MKGNACITVLFSLILGSYCADILIYSPSYSSDYLVTFGRIADTLTSAKHNVVVLTPQFKPTVFDGAKLAKVIRVSVDSNDYMELLSDYSLGLFAMETLDIVGRVRWQRTMASLCESVIKHQEELEILRSRRFQIGISGTLDYCGVGLMRYLGIPNHIWVSDTALSEAVAFLLGVPQPLSYVPVVDENDIGTDMTFMQRVHNLYMWESSYFIHVYGAYLVTSLFRKYGDASFPNVRDIAVESALCFVNSDEFVDFARPILHKTIYIGGIGFDNDTNPLPEHFLSLMKKGEKGVVMVSLGTFVPSRGIPHTKRIELFKAFMEFPDYHFIVKMDELESNKKMVEQIPNIELVDWMPQSDMLGHARVRLFITDGGMNDLLKATLHAIPILAIPLLRDEFRNARMVEARGIGLVIRKSELTYGRLRWALAELLENQSRFSETVNRFSALLRSKPNKPHDQLIKWTGFVEEFGSLPELRPFGGNYRSLKYFIFDVIIASMLFLFFTLSFKMLIVRCVWRLSVSLKSSIAPAKKID
uniref:glucuronosyltransferase n=1 Tax=Ascaris suum TaxID=6253 RepID=F1KVH4_ASCSU